MCESASFIKKSPFIEDTKLEKKRKETEPLQGANLSTSVLSCRTPAPPPSLLVLLANFPWWPEPNVMRHILLLIKLEVRIAILRANII